MRTAFFGWAAFLVGLSGCARERNTQQAFVAVDMMDGGPSADGGGGPCTPPETPCGAYCTDLSVDSYNCGSCGVVCASGQCSAGACVPLPCNPPGLVCNGVCVDASTDPNNCGACGATCYSGVCAGGQCGCASPLVLCDDGCVDASSDPNNCGGCGRICSSGACSAGICQGGTTSCASPRVLCGANCVDTTNDPNNCGACGVVCNLGICTSGVCGCDGPRTSCSGECADTTDDPYTCGSCSLACASGALCDHSSCLGAGGTGGGGAGGGGGGGAGGGAGTQPPYPGDGKCQYVNGQTVNFGWLLYRQFCADNQICPLARQNDTSCMAWTWNSGAPNGVVIGKTCDCVDLPAACTIGPLVMQLNNNSFRVRQAASAMLAQCCTIQSYRDSLQAQLNPPNNPSLEQRRRLERVISQCTAGFATCFDRNLSTTTTRNCTVHYTHNPPAAGYVNNDISDMMCRQDNLGNWYLLFSVSCPSRSDVPIQANQPGLLFVSTCRPNFFNDGTLETYLIFKGARPAYCMQTVFGRPFWPADRLAARNDARTFMNQTPPAGACTAQTWVNGTGDAVVCP